jgi:signal transduction protein with GAF and PtsI domain
MRLCCARRSLPHDAEIGNVRMKMGEGITGWVAAHNSVVALPKNASADSRFKSFSSLQEDTYEAFLSVPLVDSGEIIGVINVHHRERISIRAMKWRWSRSSASRWAA